MKHLLEEIREYNMFSNQIILVLSLIEINTVQLCQKHPGVNFRTSKISDVTSDSALLPHDVDKALEVYCDLCDTSGVVIIHCKSGVHCTGLVPLMLEETN